MELTTNQISEIIRANRILAVMVVVFTMITAVMYAKQEMLLKQEMLSTSKVMFEEKKDKSNKTLLPSPMLMPQIETAKYNREVISGQLNLKELSTVLNSANGKVTSWGDLRVPSYKSIYPVIVRVLARDVESLQSGLYRFNPDDNSLVIEATKSAVLLPDNHPAVTVAPALLIVSYKNKVSDEKASILEAGGVLQQLGIVTNTASVSGYPIYANQLGEASLNSLKFSNEEILYIFPISMRSK